MVRDGAVQPSHSLKLGWTDKDLVDGLEHVLVGTGQ